MLKTGSIYGTVALALAVKWNPPSRPNPFAGWVHADVAQLVERLPSKQNVASSRLVIRSGAQAPLSVGPVWNGHHLVAGGDRGFKSRTEDDNDVGSESCPRALCSGTSTSTLPWENIIVDDSI